MTELQEWLVAAGERTMGVDTDARDQLRTQIRDLGGVIVAGAQTSTSTAVHGYLDATAGPGGIPVLGTSRRADPVSAALANSSAAQALDYDDIAPSCVSHLGAVMIPAVLSIVDEAGPDETMEGIWLGLGVIDHLAPGFTHEIYDRGIQPTHTLGPIGAAVAMLRAVGAPPDVRRSALGLLATQLIGLRSHTGTSYKPVQAGIVAAAAVRSVVMARAGITAGGDAIDVVMRLLGLTDEELAVLSGDGELRPVPLATKAYPTCGAAHSSIEATQDARRALGVGDEAPDASISVTIPPSVMEALEFDRPTNPDQARFSLPYCVATAWVTGDVVPANFAEEVLADPIIAAAMDRVDITMDDALSPPPDWSGFPAIVEVETSSGSEKAQVERPLGYPERPMTMDQYRHKFLVCTAPVLGAERASEVFAQLEGPEVLGLMGEALILGTGP